MTFKMKYDTIGLHLKFSTFPTTTPTLEWGTNTPTLSTTTLDFLKNTYAKVRLITLGNFKDLFIVGGGGGERESYGKLCSNIKIYKVKYLVRNW